MRAAIVAFLLVLAPLSGWAQINSSEANGIQFRNSSSEQMRLTSGGWLGLGVTSPSMKFEVRDSLNGAVGAQLYNMNTGASAQTRLNVSSGSPNAYLSLFSAENTGNPYGMLTFATGLNAGYISTENNAPLIFRTNATEQMRILGDGKVGIGTTNPLASLDVRGNIYSSSTSAGFSTADRSVGVGQSSFYRTGNVTRLWDNAAGDVITYNNVGNVGIGMQPSPVAPLAVSGTIWSQSSAGGAMYMSPNSSNSIIQAVTASNNSAIPLLIQPYNNGRVGIGTFNPQVALDVSSTSNYAIRGITSAATHAIQGQTLSAAHGGVAGISANGAYYGILGHANAYSFYGSGQAYSASANSNAAINGTNSSNGPGVYGISVGGAGGHFSSTNYFGVYALSTNTHGVYGQSNVYGGVGIYGYNGNTGAYGYLGYAYFGVYCASTSGGGCGGNDVWTNHSDARLKERVKDLDESQGLGVVMKLRPVTFHWKDAKRDDNSGEQLGFIAQDVEKVAPSLVHTTPTSETVVAHDGTQTKVENVKSMSYATVVVPLVKAVQELKVENDGLKQSVHDLKAQNMRLEQAFKALEAKVDARH